VLVVDDDDETRELFSDVLHEAGAEVRTACDAKEAVRAVIQWPPTVIVCDLAMPQMDGVALQREVRTMDHARSIPAIAVTGVRLRDRVAALEAGFRELVTKPLAPDDLVAVVAKWANAPPA